MLDSGSSLVSRPSKPNPFAGCASTLVCMESGIRSGVTALASSGRGAARKVFDVGLFGLSSFSSTESRLRNVNSSDGKDWPKPSELATDSIDLKYCGGSAVTIWTTNLREAYLDSLDLQLKRCIFINHDHGMRVHLQAR